MNSTTTLPPLPKPNMVSSMTGLGYYGDDQMRAYALAALSQRTEQQAGAAQPVAWIWKYANGEEEVVFVDASKYDWDPDIHNVPSKVTPLFAHPPAAEPKGMEPLYSTRAKARRYDWLRKVWCMTILEDLMQKSVGRHPQAELDAAIDAALAADQKEKP